MDKKNNFNDELNGLFEKLLAKRDEKLRNIEEFKRQMVSKIDSEIRRLYAKKDFIAEIWSKREELKLQKVGFLKKLMRNTAIENISFIISAPFIYMMIIPAVVMHLMIEIYHQICFRVYKIPLVKPSEYFIFDRQLLPYLNWFEKFNCLYCSYFNCLVAYMREIAGRTEKYWCPIKHSRAMKDYHDHYDDFIDYSDGEALRKKWEELREFKEEE